MSDTSGAEMEKKGETIVLYPSSGMGHLISMVELGRRILQLDPPFSVTVLISPVTFNTGSTESYICSVQSSSPTINFIRLPPVSTLSHDTSSPHHEVLYFRLIRLNNTLVREALLSLTAASTFVRSIVYDFFCHPVLEVAAELQIPCYCFYTSPASSLAFFLHFPTFHSLNPSSLKDLGDTLLQFPGFPSFPASAVPAPMLDREDEAYAGFLEFSAALVKPQGIIINTFDAVEPGALQAVSDGSCVPDAPTPRVYCVGPLLSMEKEERGGECLQWLDSQPSRSVVFLCFGSLGRFSAAQLKEIAVGLERSGERFLWVVRSPPTESGSDRRFLPPPEPDLGSLMPEGFLERTRGRGLVVKSWAPQMAVLSRGSVGGFVTHCGWNSVLEALWEGVPMVAWPLYAEQRLNRVVLVDELGLAMPMAGAERGWVEAAEVERRVRGLMGSEEGRALRDRTAGMKERAREAMADGGSSHSALAKLCRAVIGC